MLLNKIVLSKTPPVSPNTVWAKPSNGGVSLYTYSNNKWGPIQSMDDMGTDNPDDDKPAKVITLELFDETIQGLKDYVSENYATNTKVSLIISRLNTLVGSDEEGHEIDVTSVIDTFNEIKDFLANIEDTTLIEMFNDVLSKLDSFNNLIRTKRIELISQGTGDSNLTFEMDSNPSYAKIYHSYQTSGNIDFLYNSLYNIRRLNLYNITKGDSVINLQDNGLTTGTKGQILFGGERNSIIKADGDLNIKSSGNIVLNKKVLIPAFGEIVFNPAITGALTVLKAGELILGNDNSGFKGRISFTSGKSSYTIGLASGDDRELQLGNGFTTLTFPSGFNLNHPSGSGNLNINMGSGSISFSKVSGIAIHQSGIIGSDTSGININGNINIGAGNVNINGTVSGGASILNMNYSGSQNTFSLDYIDSLKEKAGINTLTELVLNTNQLVGANDIPKFDPTKNYSTNDFVMYNNKLYKFTESHIGEWNIDHVSETNLVTEIDDMVKSDYETVIISLQNEQGTPLQNVFVTVLVEEELDARNLTTDENGRCSTQVTKGYEYIVSCNDVPNYYHVDSIIKRASLPERYIVLTYIEDTTLSNEHVKMTFTYYSDANLGETSRVIVSYGGQNYSISVVNNIAEFDIKIGTPYTITFEDIQGYKTPSPRTYTAEYHGNRLLNIYYLLLNSGIKWLMSDNTEKNLDDITLEDYLNDRIFGLIVLTSDLVEQGCSYVIPIGVLFGSVLSGLFLSSTVLIGNLGSYASHALALTDRNGKMNCNAILRFINSGEETTGTVYTSTMVTNCKNLSGGAKAFKATEDYSIGDYVLYQGKLHRFLVAHSAGIFIEGETEEINGFLMPDGVVKLCFCPAYGQLYAFSLNRDMVNDFTSDILNMSVVTINTGDWWSSSLFNAALGVYLRSGSFNGNGKSYWSSVLPVLAY